MYKHYCHNKCLEARETYITNNIIRCKTCGNFITEVKYTYKEINEVKKENKLKKSRYEERRFKASKHHKDYLFEERD